KADALVSDDASGVLSVRVADCVPILLASDDGRLVAAVHAGWRGTVANVVAAAAACMNEARADATPESLVAAIGPCIGFDAFEVGAEVIAEFHRVFGKDSSVRLDDPATGKGHVDLREAVRQQLLAAGVSPD